MSRIPFRIGCAGWTIPRPSGAAFPQEGSHLQRYSGRFACVEINSSFYRPHRRETYVRWASEVPASFRFSVKLPKEITHTLRLRRAARPLDRFLVEIEGLGRRLGCILIQLPPSFAFDARVVTRFLEQFRDKFDGAAVVEPRHASWFEPKPDVLLREFHIGRAGADPALNDMAALPGGDKRIAYFRLHGSPQIYFSNYSEDFLRLTAQRMLAFRGARQVWCIFDNTAHSHAVPNALRLSELLAERGR